MKKVLILGGNGFIGCNLAKELIRQGEKVVSFDLNHPKVLLEQVEYIQGDFGDEKKLNDITDDIDVVFHAVSTINPGNSTIKYMQGYTNDFIYSIRLCDIIKQKQIKMVFLSSGGTVYGNQSVQPIKEDSNLRPINHYGNIKLCIENAIHIFNYQNNTKIKIARIANPFGDGQDFNKGVGFIDAVLKKGILNEVVEIFGSGNVVRDYIYINDVCKMLCALMDYDGEEEIFNIGTGVGNSQNDIINCAKMWVPDLKIKYLESRTVDTPMIVLDNTRIKSICNWIPLELEEGMYLYYQSLKEKIIKM